jgi:hypothetical protein
MILELTVDDPEVVERRSTMRENIHLHRVGLLIAIGMALTWILTADQGGMAVLLDTVTITVQNTVLGQTTTYIGATEAGGFYIDDLTDLGINTYRLWTKMGELEWWDDDDAMDEEWDDSEYGTPITATIKADQPYGFTNTIPWAWWDARFTETQAWRYGTQTRQGIIAALTSNNITPIVVLRTYDDQGNPEQRPTAQWSPRPPVDDDFRNEWWEHCFAVAYWLNVRNSYAVTRFEVLNEPDYSGQGWTGWPNADEAGYVQLVRDAYDAVKFANDIVGLPTYIHAPVVASYGSNYLSYSLQNADAQIQVVDYHTYANDPTTSINSVQSTISSNNPDGVTEPIWVSEWGALWTTYDTINRALLTAEQLMTFSEEEVEGVTIFNMYDWSTTAGQDYGVIDLQDDGEGGANRVPTETYYAYRLMTRGLKNAKDRLDFTSSGLGSSGRVMVTRDADNLYVIVKNGNGLVTVDISAVPGYSGTATVYEYSAANKDVVVATPTVTNGQFSFTAPTTGLSLARVPAQATHAHITRITARSGPEPPWWVRLIRAITQFITHRQ